MGHPSFCTGGNWKFKCSFNSKIQSFRKGAFKLPLIRLAKCVPWANVACNDNPGWMDTTPCLFNWGKGHGKSQGPFGPVDQTRQGNRHTFRVDLKMKGIHCPLNHGCLFHVPPAQHVLITTRMTCLFLGSWIPNLLFPEHASYRKKWWETYLLKIWAQSNVHSNTIPGMFLKKMLNMVMWVWLNRTHLSGFCFQSISNTVDTVCLTHKKNIICLEKWTETNITFLTI